ncbi:MAG TPA: formyltetrahydrofolate deformylase [Acidimicrobiales bacterium]|nr:formyltetrahydrofolate deformylase [Acidimicrobiales bacterium]
MEPPGEVVVTLTCPDRVGVVSAVAGLLAARDVNILESQQFSDVDSGQFFMRVQAALPAGLDAAQLDEQFGPVAEQFSMRLAVHDRGERPRLLILVSRLGHCLNDLLYRHRIGVLRAELSSVVSNHPDLEDLARSSGVPFHYLPVTPETKAAQEAELLALVAEQHIELVVLARYMQILSGPTTQALAGRAINIHHGLLPSFKGARPYHQAYERGFKLVGATAHYVTTDLDEGPIIEQEVARVDHTDIPEELVAIGRDIECVVLARAVTWHLERRVLMNGKKTVVFR